MKIKKYKLFISVMVSLMVIFIMATLRIAAMPGNIRLTYDSKNIENIKAGNLESNFLYKIDGNSTKLSSKSKSLLEKLDVDVKLFGVIPVKKMTINFTPELKVIPGGQPIGVKLHTNGVLVVGLSDIETKSGKIQSPAVSGGIEIGDSIVEINNSKVESISQLSDIVNKNREKELNILISRKGEIKNVKIKPVESLDENEYKIGLWVRDSTAGVGTLTFYDPNSRKYGALGHPINDVDTGKLLSVRNGNIYSAKIISVQMGMRGNPGELRGIFSEEDLLGNLERNTNCGIYGSIKKENFDLGQAIPIARQEEIQEGPAKILTSIHGSDVKAYDIYIERLTSQSKSNSKSMIIRVTDKELLEKTGGIVQGMSGSPIIQNGKLAGAVTHVFVNRPDMGYGIYIEWMLNEAKIDY